MVSWLTEDVSYTLVSFLAGQIQTKSFPPAPGPSLCPSLPDSSHFLSPVLGHTLNDQLQLGGSLGSPEVALSQPPVGKGFPETLLQPFPEQTHVGCSQPTGRASGSFCVPWSEWLEEAQGAELGHLVPSESSLWLEFPP